jgi:16S rRNA (guanine1207-N2)-methyltransferase
MQTVTSLLLEESPYAHSGASCLVLGGEADLPNALAEKGGTSWLPLLVTERDRATTDVVVCDAVNLGAYGRILLPVPADRDLARRLLLTAREALAPTGELVLAGANSEGAKSVIADATEVFGDPTSSGYRQKHRIARFVVPPSWQELPGWAEADGVRTNTWQRFTVDTPVGALELDTQPGVFAAGRLDVGTALLLDHLSVPEHSRVLDVGSGAGIIGILAGRMGALHVDLVDANLLAVQASARNLARHNVSGRALASDVYDAVRGEQYDLIVSNPPFHRGKQVDTSVADRLIAEAPAHVLPGGQLLVVANAFLAYGRVMERAFRHVETVAATRQYHVLMASEPR